jgi:orotate phosphoribosyltransferase
MTNTITLPSGKELTWTDRAMFSYMHKFGFIKYSEDPFVLKSGIQSNVYVYGREDVTDNPGFERELGQKISTAVFHVMETAYPDGQTWRACLVGVPTAGTVLAQAASSIFWYSGYPEVEASMRTRVCHRVMRETKKTYGAHQTWINGRPSPEFTYWLVDNVATDGQSKIEARDKLAEDGYPTQDTYCLILVDRQQGAVQRLQKLGLFKEVIVLYNLLDITFALGEMGLWPKDAVEKVREEITAHCQQ